MVQASDPMTPKGPKHAVKLGSPIITTPKHTGSPQHVRARRQTSVGAARVPGLKDLGQVRSDLANLSGPKFTSPTGALTSLLFLNLAWSMWRTIVAEGNRTTLVQNVAGIWVVGLGILVVAEFEPKLALLFAILFTIGNVIMSTGNKTAVQANKTAVQAFSDIFTKGS